MKFSLILKNNIFFMKFHKIIKYRIFSISVIYQKNLKNIKLILKWKKIILSNLIKILFLFIIYYYNL